MSKPSSPLVPKFNAVVMPSGSTSLTTPRGTLLTPRADLLSMEEVIAEVEKRKAWARNNAAGTDQALFEKLVVESALCRQAGRIKPALHRCYEVLACVEMNRKAMGEDQKELHAFALSNLASSLHLLGNLGVAKRMYEQAHQELVNSPKSFIDMLCFADVRGAQLDYIMSRAEMAANGKTPDSREYLDGTGTQRLWTEDEMADALPRVKVIEAELEAMKPQLSLNNGSLSGPSHKSYAITTTPRQALW